jgi:hypothetical protein
MPHNITGTNVFTDPVPALADGDPVAQASNDPAFQALANRDVNLGAQITALAASADARLDGIELYVLQPGLRAKSSGNGSDTIAGYRRGTFTPAIEVFGGAANFTTNVASGTFVRIGDMVMFYVKLNVTKNSGATGTVGISGFPYAMNNDIVNLGFDIAACSIGGGSPFKSPYALRASTPTAAIFYAISTGTDLATTIDPSTLANGVAINMEFAGHYMTTAAAAF